MQPLGHFDTVRHWILLLGYETSMDFRVFADETRLLQGARDLL